MNILIVLNAVLPATLYGGTQRVMWYLGRELAAMGHSVSFLCRQGSYADFARIIPLDISRPAVVQIPDDIDIVHFNNGVPEDYSQSPLAKPYVVTFHGNSIPQGGDHNGIFVSRDHAARFGSESFVYNGLDWDDYRKPAYRDKSNNGRRHFHFLGKAAWRVKNVRGAIRIVERLRGERLVVLGGTRLNLKMGFRLTLSPKVRFKGMVGGDEKLRWLYSSKGLIFPVKWEEPFGLAVTESLFCGSPVFATPRGSMPELVAPEVGFLGSEDEILRHLRDGGAAGYSPEICRQYAADLFNSRVMAGQYLCKYESVLNGYSLNESG